MFPGDGGDSWTLGFTQKDLQVVLNMCKVTIDCIYITLAVFQFGRS